MSLTFQQSNVENRESLNIGRKNFPIYDKICASRWLYHNLHLKIDFFLLKTFPFFFGERGCNHWPEIAWNLEQTKKHQLQKEPIQNKSPKVLCAYSHINLKYESRIRSQNIYFILYHQTLKWKLQMFTDIYEIFLFAPWESQVFQSGALYWFYLLWHNILRKTSLEM